MTEQEKRLNEILKVWSKKDLWEQAQNKNAIIAQLRHRAEVAERQAVVLSKWLAEKTRKNYPWQAWFDAAQKQAEKEIAEEDKR